MTVRGFECEFSVGPCIDHRCKRGFCARERDEITKPAQIKAENDSYPPGARAVVRELVRKMLLRRNSN